MDLNFHIDSNIKKARTLPGHFYKDKNIFEAFNKILFSQSWQWGFDQFSENNNAVPRILLPRILNEPILFTKDKNGEAQCISNVCTHRAKIIIEEPGNYRLLSCGYHGRCFGLNGKFKSMPEFEGLDNFPCEDDHLAQIPLVNFLGLNWISINPKHSFTDMIKPMWERISFLPWDTLYIPAEKTTHYSVNAHWSLYVDNYLEGFHIPFVHPALNVALVIEDYAVELFPHMSLQVGVAKENEPYFELPEGHPDFGKKIFAYYFWLFPNIMFNIYPFGLSLNIVKPISIDKTEVEFRSYSFKETGDSSSYALHETEMEDEAIVQSVQKGVQSNFYQRGRYSPTMEKGVHHFHRMLSGAFEELKKNEQEESN